MVLVESAEAGTPAVAEEPLLDAAERRAVRIGVAVAMVVFLLAATGGTPWHLFDRGPYTSDFYDVQARALVQGRLDVPADVMGIEGFVVDGKTQMYFGLGPALLRLPLVAWGDGLDGRLSVLSQVVAVGLLGLASARLLARARRLVSAAPRGRPWWFAAGAVLPALATPVVYLVARASVYHEAELWGAAACLVGLDLVLRWHDRPTTRHLVVAVAVATFALAVRLPTGVAPALALGLFGLGLLLRGHWRRAAVVLAGAALPFVAFVAVNQARFGSPLDVPFPQQVITQVSPDRQAALEDNDGSLFGLGFAPTNLARYLSPVAVEPQRLFPFVGWSPPVDVVGDVTFESVDHSSSLPVGAPAFVVLAAVGAWWTLRRDRGWTWRVVVLSAGAGTVSTLTISTVAQRYLVDLVPLVLLLAAPAVWVWARSAGGWPRWLRRGSVVLMGLLALAGTWTQLGLALQARAFSILPSSDQLLETTRFQYELDDRLFGGSPPQVRVVPGPDLPSTGVADGELVILGDCSGLYRYDGYGWGTLERAAGGGRRLLLSGSVTDVPVAVASGEGWSMEIVPDAGAATVVYRSDGRPDLESEPFALEQGLVVVDVVADPAVGQIVVEVGGHRALNALYVAASGLTAAPGWQPLEAPAAFCESLLARIADADEVR